MSSFIIASNITQTPTQHGYKAQHSTVTALRTLNNTVAQGFNQMAPPARTITVALDMSKTFDTVNTHPNWKAATDQHPWYDFKVRCELHQGTQSLY